MKTITEMLLIAQGRGHDSLSLQIALEMADWRNDGTEWVRLMNKLRELSR
jgi:hypothetical protein